tara:strand:- start:79 stop:1578 length:1500 start_codon:yes stop_codon:yes gene_type:complete
MKSSVAIKLHTSACDLLGCRYPVVLAGMGGVSRSELVVAVTQAGGYGFLGMVRESPVLIETEIKKVRAKTDKEFGINIIPAATDPELLNSQIEICIKEQVASVCLFWDVFPDVIKRLKEAGILVVHQVGSVKDAEEAQAAGVHLLIAQGIEAGGHVRGTLPLRELLPRVLRMAEVPVLAAGGIVDGNDVAEILMTGADGAVVGTAFLATKESFANDYHKRQIINSEKDETVLTNLFHINWPFGALTRVLPNSVTRTTLVSELSVDEKKMVIGTDDKRSIYLYSTDSPLKTTVGDLEAMAIYAGCGASRIKKIESAICRLNTMVSEAQVKLSKLFDTQNYQGNHAQLYSSPCFAEEEELHEKSFAESETIKRLEELLFAEYAGARVTLRSMLDSDNDHYKEIFRSIYYDEVRWCDMLTNWLYRLDHEPSYKVGDFYLKAINIKDYENRIAYLNKGQGWVVKKIKEILANINNLALQEDLNDMLISHVANIALTKKNMDAA